MSIDSMEKIRQLLAAMAALTLLLSAISSVNPNYFAGYNAFAEDDSDDDNSNSSEEEHDESEDESDSVSSSFGESSSVMLKIDDEVEDEGSDAGSVMAELEIETDGDMDDGDYAVSLTCDTPALDETFDGSLTVVEGKGEFKTDLALVNGTTYDGCEVGIGETSVALDSFTVSVSSDTEEDDDQGKEKGANGRENNSARGHDDDDDEEDDDQNENGANSSAAADDDIKEKRKENRREIVASSDVREDHWRRIKADPASPGDYQPGWNYTLLAEGNAALGSGEEENSVGSNTTSTSNSTSTSNTTSTEPVVVDSADANVSIDMAVWKSNRAMILLNVLNGTLEVGGETYNVELGYALYSIDHDAMRIHAFVTDEDGNILKLKLRGHAVEEEAGFPAAAGESLDLVFDGTGGYAGNGLESYQGLTLEGTLTAN